MVSQFLEDLTRAGDAVWEHYLRPFSGQEPSEPPAFPVWDAVTDNAIESFIIKYGHAYDWRVWLGWSMAFSCLSIPAAEVLDTPEAFSDAHKFAELLAVHMGERCPGEHSEPNPDMLAALKQLPEYSAPNWTYGSQDIDRFRFEVAAHQEWLYLQGSFIPELELTPARREEVLNLSSEIENALFQDASLETILGLHTLTGHLAAQKLDLQVGQQLAAGKRVMCVQAHGMTDAVKHYATTWLLNRAISQQFKAFRLN